MKKWGFYIVVSLQVLFILVMAVSYYITPVVGEVVKLKTVPVDPPDLFYGDYVRLRYEVEEIPNENWFVRKDEEIHLGDKVYVILKPNSNGIYEVKSASTIKGDAVGNEVIIISKYQGSSHESHYVDLGISRYFIEDNTGEKYEQNEEMIVTVAIAPWGIKRILSLNPVK